MQIVSILILSLFTSLAVAAVDCNPKDDIEKIEIICGGKGPCPQNKYKQRLGPDEYLKCIEDEMNKLSSKSSSDAIKKKSAPPSKTGR